MKKTLTIITIALLAILTLATTVNAAKLEVSKTDVKAGDEVSVTLSLDKESHSLEFELKYDAELFEYKGYTAPEGWTMVVGTKTAGLVLVSGVNPTTAADKMTITFTAKKDGAAKFTASDLVTEEDTEGKMEELAVKEVEVKVEQKDVAPEPETETTTPATTAKAGTTTPKKTNNPKTGDNVVVYAGLAVVAIVAVAAVAKKYAK